jgi:alpha 1,3-glucosidase
VRLRYQMLPVWYNAFYDASVGGYPIMRYVCPWN